MMNTTVQTLFTEGIITILTDFLVTVVLVHLAIFLMVGGIRALVIVKFHQSILALIPVHLFMRLEWCVLA